ncbi:ATP synthase F1 subunit epsilon [Formicincola oecophyllae]|uniref:ATP synthase epsilon chain n=1 Tax=Formicincola oecophyllae TaxID=2558361 RepID=A0A4Y6UAE9_9PROT|nr:ATP synthase F1 subunit epsilon [Formicincola oecophyllae]QDH13436.1 ATP synthase F1 subunit epsilon [Formicincola oecophyllae]
MALRAEIVSPEKRCVSREADMVVVPGSEGDIAAMPGMAPVMLYLRGGVIDIYEGDKIVDRFFVSGGFVDMAPDHCIILADSVRKLEELDADDAQKRLDNLELAWSQLGPDAAPVERNDLTHQIQVAQAEIDTARTLNAH